MVLNVLVDKGVLRVPKMKLQGYLLIGDPGDNALNKSRSHVLVCKSPIKLQFKYEENLFNGSKDNGQLYY